MALPVTYIGSNLLASDRASPVRGIVTCGMAYLDATRAHPAPMANTYAPLPTMLNNATLLCDLLVIKTPFIPDEWEHLLNLITPFNKFSDVPIGMCFSFDMGARLPPLQTYTPPNHNSALLFPDHVLSHIHNELSLGRYSGPSLAPDSSS